MQPRQHAVSTAEVQRERPPRILVIDDDRYVRMLLWDLLNAWGYEVDLAADGVAGLALFERGVYAAVLTDFAMPNVTGLDVVAGVRDRDPSIAIIVFTAFMGELGSEDERLGINKVLRKPLDINGLRTALRDTLAGSTSV